MTQEQKGHLTSLLSVGMALLFYAVETLEIDEMKSWGLIEKGRTKVLREAI